MGKTRSVFISVGGEEKEIAIRGASKTGKTLQVREVYHSMLGERNSCRSS